MKKKSELITFLVSARKLTTKILKFNSRFSNKIFDNHLLMIIKKPEDSIFKNGAEYSRFNEPEKFIFIRKILTDFAIYFGV